ncbi:unnamed protein product [Cylindrotheca closterium]|uniref:Uncharacterized protein n=1 Tax=Cylindrotheca closterium TaxID=2856 RepID=A0AAD2FF24_9STRA|nr:unnamed protein product [Cylindrotheca closterium]
MSKSRSHRKRHVPPGPVGIWFRTQQQQLHSKNQGSVTTVNAEQRSSKGDSSDNASHSDKSNNHKGGRDSSFSPVWSNVQEDLKLNTPYLSSWNGDPKQKYDELRPHLPPDFILLREVLRGDHDFAIPPGFHLLLLVNSIESHNLHSICTVELYDETGLSVRAWVEPRYVQEQMRKQQEASTIRTGVVWMLQEIGMMVQMNEDDEKLERILLIGGKHITKVWTPEDAKDMDFLQHMERKKAISQHIFEIDNDVDSVHDGLHEEDVHETGDSDQATKDNGIAGGTCDQRFFFFSHATKKGEEKNLKTKNNSLPLIGTEQSTAKSSSQDVSCRPSEQNALVDTTTNCPSVPFLEKEETEAQSFNEQKSGTTLTDKNNRHNKRHDEKLHQHAKNRRKRSKPSLQSPTQAEGGPHRISNSLASCLWDNVQTDEVLELFDDNEDDSDTFANNLAHPQSIQAKNISLSSEGSRHKEEERRSSTTRPQPQKSDEMVPQSRFGLCSSLSQDQNENDPSFSLFEVSHLAGLDLSAFDDD